MQLETITYKSSQYIHKHVCMHAGIFTHIHICIYTYIEHMYIYVYVYTYQSNVLRMRMHMCQEVLVPLHCLYPYGLTFV